MWVIFTGVALFAVGIFVLLVVLSPKGDERPRVFTCQRCGTAFSNPPLHPLPERYQEDDLCLCDGCSEQMEERVRDVVRRAQAEFLAEKATATGPTAG